MTNREIADRLYLSTHTVITHRRNIARKLQVHSASGLTVYAIVNKLIELKRLERLTNSTRSLALLSNFSTLNFLISIK